jgi:hypothetical protein
MPNKTGYIKTYNPQKIKKTVFETKWGEPAYKIAERENVATTTIHMRVRNYGNPWQRKAKPSHYEAKYGKTVVEISKELYMHPVALNLREKTHGSVYCEDIVTDTGVHRNRKTEQYKHTDHWSTLRHYAGDRFWLMPDHPDYDYERSKCLLWECEKHIAIAKRRAGV